MIKNIKIHFTGSGTDEKITIPVSAFHISEKLLPKTVREALQKECIDLSPLSELPMKEKLFGDIITIETPDNRIIVSVD